MGEIVNLKRERKRRERAERDREAAANRAAFGRTKAGKALGKAEEELRRRGLDSHRIDDASLQDDEEPDRR